MFQPYFRVTSILLIILISQSSAAETSPSSLNDAAQYFAKAKQLTEQGKVDQAILSYQSIIDKNPLLPEAYNNLAALYLKQNKIKEAKNILEKGIYAHKGYALLYEGLTTINVAMAREAYSKALQIDLQSSAISIAEVELAAVNVQPDNQSIVIPKVDSKNSTIVEKNQVINVESEQLTEEEKLAAIAKIKKIVQPQIKNTVVSEPAKNVEAIEVILQAWSAAWSAQATDMYLSFYHTHYKPSNGLSKKAWVQSRRLRVKKPAWIKINLSDIDVKKNTGTQAVVNFKQTYQSDRFKDVSSKQMVLLNTDDGWRIFRERSL